MNSFGNIFRITTSGESHGKAMTVIVDGCPSGITLTEEIIQQHLAKRRPGQSEITTTRKEEDVPLLLSGVFEGLTTGAPICIQILNKDQKSSDYDSLKNLYRPSHADYTYSQKYTNRDHRGGGRASARETANWVAAGAVAQQILKNEKIDIKAWVSQIHSLKIQSSYQELDLNQIESNSVRCPDPDLARKMEALIIEAQAQGDSLGGCISARITGMQAGIGSPVFKKLHADLGHAMLSINAVKGFEFGSGFAAAEMKGSEHNDAFASKGEKIETKTNFSGGIQGGISNGEDIYFKLAFKPTATIAKVQNTVDKSGNELELSAAGRHDPCVLPRAVPIVEAMASLVLVDHLMLAKMYH